MAFGAPDSSQFKPEDHEGELLLVLPHRYLTGVNTTFGVKDAIDCEVVILDGDDAGTRIPTARVFSLVMLGQLRAKVGTTSAVLGRLGKGQPKAGQKPPWKLLDPTDDDIEIATKWEKSNGELRQPEMATAGGGGEDGEQWKVGGSEPPKSGSYDKPPF